MTTARDIISDALRESGILAIGETPSADIQAEGLKRLNVIVKSLFGNEIGENFTDYSFGTNGVDTEEGIDEDVSTEVLDTFLPSNSRLYVNQNTANTIYLDPNPEDGARIHIIDSSENFHTYPLTIDANGRKIENGASHTLSSQHTNVEYFYRADLGAWVKSADLAAFDDVPFPTEFEDLLVTYLAMRLNPRYGQSIPPESLEVMRRARSQLKARYKQTRETPAEIGLLKLSTDNKYYSVPTRIFKRGDLWNY